MRCRHRLGVAAACLALAACHTMQQQPQEVPYPPQRIFQNSYSFMPPAELGWRVLVRRGNQLALARRGSSPDETYAIQGRVFQLPAYASSEEFVALITKALAEQAADPRYRTLKHEVSAEPSKQTDCAKSHFVAEDNAAVKQTSTPGAMILEVRTLSCAHPKRRDAVVTLVFSHRYTPGQSDPKFADKAAAFLSSMEFLE